MIDEEDEDEDESEDLSNQIYECLIVAGPKILDVILEELQKSIIKVEESK